MRALRMFAAAAILVMAWSRVSLADAGFKSVDFTTDGGIEARADIYGEASPSATWILLFHQAGSSRGEYREIAPKLVAAGYRVMAVDQRSGRGVNAVRNETARRAAAKKLPSRYLDAYADLEAALSYARTKLGAKRVLVWGSSYSASLVCRLAAEHESEVTAVLAFSPGEYFKKEEGPTYVQSFARRISQPLFVTSSKSERGQVKPIFDASPAKKKVLFTPASRGQHGSRALWSKWPDNDVYWAAVKGFLSKYAPAKPGQ